MRLLSVVFVIVGWLLFLGLFGGVWTAFICCFQSDSKRLIAYSSVAHMNFMLGGVFSFFSKTKSFCVLVMLVHGFVSASLFFFIGGFYYFVLTRRLYFSTLTYKAVIIPLFFFLVTRVANFGVPPFLSRIAELFFFSYFVLFSSIYCVVLFLYGLIVCYFCVYLLLVLLHGKKRWSFPLFAFAGESVRGVLMRGLAANFLLLVFLF